ncbi:hypothetical protein Pcinc_002879 [Petrolisthes cinctipes]|uniref:Uncharacterized protein n=1 Tax=Petrolisthes cinctipes TaxID=88211 RepID=A0AAE1GHU6_PETCI|nr:hypothetical protein Pcinc_002879 [Petrolisthes cinctipes]
MANIHVQSELIQGPVRVAVLETDLPIPGVTFLLGNDLAGHGMILDVVVREKPVNESPTAKLDQEKPHLFPICVVTRSKSVSVAVDFPSLPHRDTLFSRVMNMENLIRGQKEDPSLAKLRHIADDKPINGVDNRIADALSRDLETSFSRDHTTIILTSSVPFRGLKGGGVTDSWSRPPSVPSRVVSLMGVLSFHTLLSPLAARLSVLFAKVSIVYNPFIYSVSHHRYRPFGRHTVSSL